MDTSPFTVYCSGPCGAVKKHRMASLVQALTQHGLHVGVLRPRTGSRPGDDADVLVAAGARTHADFCAGTIAAAHGSSAAAVFENRLFADCHILLVDMEHYGTESNAVIEIGDQGYAGFGRICPDAGTMSVCIRDAVLRPLVAGAVLAGGRSSRLGRNKALLPFHGTTVIDRVINELRPCVSETTIITNTADEYRHLGHPCQADVLPGGGPLSGIHAALTHCRTESVLVVSCDIPLVTRRHFQELIEFAPGHDIVIYKHSHFEPLCALYRRTCLGALEELIHHGEYRIIDLFPSLRVKVIRTASSDVFKSINTDADYEFMQSSLPESARGFDARVSEGYAGPAGAPGDAEKS